ncbi:MAG: hypothetical protein GY708_25085, partial [Actinomycetia bacterium]|nr:hypothetical protein [Actinomycetes bacterium]
MTARRVRWACLAVGLAVIAMVPVLGTDAVSAQQGGDLPFPWVFEGEGVYHVEASLQFGAQGSYSLDVPLDLTVTLNDDGTIEYRSLAEKQSTRRLANCTNGQFATLPNDREPVLDTYSGTHSNGTVHVVTPGTLTFDANFTASELTGGYEVSGSTDCDGAGTHAWRIVVSFTLPRVSPVVATTTTATPTTAAVTSTVASTPTSTEPTSVDTTVADETSEETVASSEDAQESDDGFITDEEALAASIAAALIILIMSGLTLAEAGVALTEMFGEAGARVAATLGSLDEELAGKPRAEPEWLDPTEEEPSSESQGPAVDPDTADVLAGQAMDRTGDDIAGAPETEATIDEIEAIRDRIRAGTYTDEDVDRLVELRDRPADAPSPDMNPERADTLARQGEDRLVDDAGRTVALEPLLDEIDEIQERIASGDYTQADIDRLRGIRDFAAGTNEARDAADDVFRAVEDVLLQQGELAANLGHAASKAAIGVLAEAQFGPVAGRLISATYGGVTDAILNRGLGADKALSIGILNAGSELVMGGMAERLKDAAGLTRVTGNSMTAGVTSAMQNYAEQYIRHNGDTSKINMDQVWTAGKTSAMLAGGAEMAAGPRVPDGDLGGTPTSSTLSDDVTPPTSSLGDDVATARSAPASGAVAPEAPTPSARTSGGRSPVDGTDFGDEAAATTRQAPVGGSPGADDVGTASRSTG